MRESFNWFKVKLFSARDKSLFVFSEKKAGFINCIDAYPVPYSFAIVLIEADTIRINIL